MSFGGFGSTGFGQNNQQQSTGFGGFGANTNTTTGTFPPFHSSPVAALLPLPSSPVPLPRHPSRRHSQRSAMTDMVRLRCSSHHRLRYKYHGPACHRRTLWRDRHRHNRLRQRHIRRRHWIRSCETRLRHNNNNQRRRSLWLDDCDRRSLWLWQHGLRRQHCRYHDQHTLRRRRHHVAVRWNQTRHDRFRHGHERIWWRRCYRWRWPFRRRRHDSGNHRLRGDKQPRYRHQRRRPPGHRRCPLHRDRREGVQQHEPEQRIPEHPVSGRVQTVVR